MVKLNGNAGINKYGVYPFARRYVGEKYLVYRTEYGGEILFIDDEVDIVKNNI